jgi:hypothetical protein
VLRAKSFRTRNNLFQCCQLSRSLNTAQASSGVQLMSTSVRRACVGMVQPDVLNPAETGPV